MLLAVASAALSPADLGALQVDAVRSAMAKHAKTQPGAALSATLPLLDNLEQIQETYSAVGEALGLKTEERPPLRHDLALSPIFQALTSEGRTDLESLHTVSSAVGALSTLARWGDDPERQMTVPRLAALAIGASPPARLSDRFSSAFERVKEGVEGKERVRLSSAAFPALKSRRSAVATAEAALGRAVKSLSSSGELRQFLADSDATLQPRDGRYVVPVLLANKNLAGVEVGVSRTGKTCFVEPHTLVPLSSAARAAQAALQACEAKLLAALCALLLTNLGELCDAIDAAAELDTLLGRASLSIEWQGSIPYVGDQGVLRVRNARHPLLALQSNGGRVTGNTLALQAGVASSAGAAVASASAAEAEAEADAAAPQALLLTGPNGGGKSVVLKTAALYAVLIRLGLPLPCDATDARVDLFDAVCTDLADAQNLGEGASSFAAHVRSCKQALSEASRTRAAGKHALVVLDEPGAATDATQGSAIAQAVIEALLCVQAAPPPARFQPVLSLYLS